MHFYKLTNEELLQMRDLTPTQIIILLYLKSLDPFYEKTLEISVSQIARDLNLTRKTVSKAIDTLHHHGYIHREMTHCLVKVLPHPAPTPETETKQDIDEVSKNYSGGCVKITQVSKNYSGGVSKNYSGVRKNYSGGDGAQTQAEQEPQEFSTAPKTRSDYKDQDQIEGDKKFLEFVIAQLKAKGIDMTNPTAYAKKCISDRPDYWRGLWQETNHHATKRPPNLEILIGGFRQALKAQDWAFARKRVLEIQEIAPEVAQRLGAELLEQETDHYVG
jgi:DNA-binding CsgD family transcriptional regulator